jgi:hypothetical protein
MSSLPVPLSPMMSTVASVGPMRDSVCCSRFISGDSPMIGGTPRSVPSAARVAPPKRASTRSSAPRVSGLVR